MTETRDCAGLHGRDAGALLGHLRWMMRLWWNNGHVGFEGELPVA